MPRRRSTRSAPSSKLSSMHPPLVSDQAELVAFRVGHDDVVGFAQPLVLVYYGRTGGGQSANQFQHARPPHLPRCVASAADLDVDVQPVLDHLRLRHPQEGQAGAYPIRIGQVGAVIPLVLGNVVLDEPFRPTREPVRWWLLDVSQ